MCLLLVKMSTVSNVVEYQNGGQFGVEVPGEGNLLLPFEGIRICYEDYKQDRIKFKIMDLHIDMQILVFTHLTLRAHSRPFCGH